MKKIRFLYNILCLFLLTLLLVGCKKMDFNYRQFIEDGETTYIGKADSLLVRGGNQRVELHWLLISDPKVDSYKIYWNNRQDSVMGQLYKTDQIDTVVVPLRNLEEKTHEFEVFQFDRLGNTSIRSSVVGKVYGSRYENSLVNRAFNETEYIGRDRMEITWADPELQLLFSEIKYRNTNDDEVIYRVNRDSEIDTLYNFPNGGKFELRSAFIPDSLALDTFYTDYTVFEFEAEENPLLLSFSTKYQYGSQDNQLAVLISTDFNGSYEAADVNAATWIDITDDFVLSSGGDSFISSGLKDISEYELPNKLFYIAFRYTYSPDLGTNPRNWFLEDVLVETQNGNRKSGVEGSGFNFVIIGDTDRDVAVLGSTGRITFRGNSGLEDRSLVTWGISKPL